MSKNNKQFVRNIMIVSVLGLSILMIVLFIVLQSYLNEPNSQSTYNKIEEEISEPMVELSETLTVRVEQINSTYIMGYDIYNKEKFNKVMDETVKVSDSYGNVLPISQIKAGDIVEVDYQKQKEKIIAISKSSVVKSWNKISGVTINQEDRQVNIGGSIYNYTDETLVIEADGVLGSITKVGPFDIVSIQAIDHTIWSITVEEASASLNLSELPTSNGQIEIDNSRLLMFKDVKEPIKLIAGKHKIVIKMKGYETITEEIIVEPNEIYELSLKEAEIAYCVVKPYVSTKIEDYTITIDHKTYKPGDEIKLQQGEYKIEAVAEGYHKIIKNVSLNKSAYTLSLLFTPIEEEKEEEENTSTNTNTSNEAVKDSRTITINSDPEGAKVYIDGALKGTTPYTITLNKGTYSILLEKSAYQIYSTSILLDGSNDQSAFLYKLTPQE